MTLSQLRTFAAVADAGSVRGAAQRLHVTQPAVSAAVRALERSLGVELVEPDGRGVRLTAAGTALAPYVRRVLGLLDEATLAARGGADPTRGTLRIGAVPTASEHVLPGFLAAFRRRYPAVPVMLEVGAKEQVWTWMSRHTVDVAVAGRPPDDATLQVRATRHNDVVVVAARGAVDAAGVASGERTLASMAARTWLLREQGSGTRAALEALLATAEIAPEVLTLGSNGAVIAGAVAGLGVTLLSRDAVRRELAAGDLVEVPTDVTPLVRPWHLVTRVDTPATAELFVRHVLSTDPDAPRPHFTRIEPDAPGTAVP